MRKILKLAETVWVTVTLDEKVPRERLKFPQNLFHMSGLMMERLVRTAAEEGVEIEEDVLIQEGEESRFSGKPALKFLERHMFRYGKAQYEKEQEEIQIFSAATPRQEMEEIARRMRMLVRTRGFGMAILR